MKFENNVYPDDTEWQGIAAEFDKQGRPTKANVNGVPYRRITENGEMVFVRLGAPTMGGEYLGTGNPPLENKPRKATRKKAEKKAEEDPETDEE